MQAAQAYLKITNLQNIEFSKLDSVIDYNDDVLRQIAETKRRLLINGADTVKIKHQYDSLLATPKTKYYVINYLDKIKNAATGNWQMLVMDTAFKIRNATN